MPIAQTILGQAIPANRYAGAFAASVFDLSINLVDSGVVHKRPNTHTIVETIAGLQAADPFCQCADKCISGITMHIETVRADARLPRVQELQRSSTFGSLFRVSIGIDDERSMAPKFDRNPLQR